MGAIKLPHASGNSMSIAAPASNPSGHLEIKVPATIGSAKQVLRNSSTAGTLEFGNGYGEQLANVTSASTVSNITHDSLDTSIYRGFHLIGSFMPVTDDIALNFYWRSGGSDCVADKYGLGQFLVYPTDNEATNAAQNQGRLQLLGNAGNATREGWRISLFIFPHRSGDPIDGTSFCSWQGCYRSSGHDIRSVYGNGDYDVANIYPDGFKLQAHSGSLADQNYVLYGLLR